VLMRRVWQSYLCRFSTAGCLTLARPFQVVARFGEFGGSRVRSLLRS
jgi:hypothetical protein